MTVNVKLNLKVVTDDYILDIMFQNTIALVFPLTLAPFTDKSPWSLSSQCQWYLRQQEVSTEWC